MKISNRRYFFNENCFDCITKEDQAYWLGFLVADGSIQKSTLSLEISEKDRHHLAKFRLFVRGEQPIKPRRKKCYRIMVSSKHLIHTVQQYGLVPNKSLITRTPALPNHLLRHFYRGVFDGDGWITNRYLKTGKKSWELCFSSGCKAFLNEIHQWVCSETKQQRGYIIHRNRHNQSVYELHFGGNKIFPAVAALLYGDAGIWLDRKKTLIQEAITSLSSAS